MPAQPHCLNPHRKPTEEQIQRPRTQIVEHWGVVDGVGVLQQLGLMPTPA
jgi:hypothetical protein